MVKIHLIEAINKNNSEDLGFENFSFGYLMSYAEKYGDYNDIKRYKSSEKIKFEELPDIVGISSITRNFMIAKLLAKNIKKISKDIIVVMGGIHVSLLPFSSPIEADFIVIGEGEQTFLELLDCITKKRGNVKNIKGILYRENDEFLFAGPRELIKDLDTIPHPKRSLNSIKSNSVPMLTSRGCPYSCPFCPAAKLWKSIRYHSAKYVIEELEELIEKYHTKKIAIADDLFVADKHRLNEIITEIEIRGWNKIVSFSLSARSDLINEELISMFKRMNVVEVGLGIESGSENMLKIIKKNTVTLEQNYKAIDILQTNGIDAIGTFMMGYPGETIEDIEKTLKFIKQTKIAQGGTQITQPYPGTDLWNLALEKGLVFEEMDWSSFQVDFGANFEKSLIISDIDRKTLHKYYLKFVELWFSKYMKKDLSWNKYLNKLRFNYILKIVKKPSKAVYLLKIVLNILKDKIMTPLATS